MARVVSRKVKKYSARTYKLARKYKVKVSLKRGSKRVFKSEKLILKQIKRKMRKMRKSRKSRKSRKTRKTRRVRRVRRSRFGFGQLRGSEYIKDVPGYGYNMPVVQKAGIPSQSSELVMNGMANSSRPNGFKLDDQYVPTYGTYAAFFDQAVPRVIPPNWQFMGQPDGSSVALGSPFYRYTSESGFGKRRKRYFIEDSSCNRHRKSVCKSMPNCTYTKGRGCRRRKGTVKGGLVYEGPSLAAFGKRRRMLRFGALPKQLQSYKYPANLNKPNKGAGGVFIGSRPINILQIKNEGDAYRRAHSKPHNIMKRKN
jgi:hypothetical protein